MDITRSIMEKKTDRGRRFNAAWSLERRFFLQVSEVYNGNVWISTESYFYEQK